ncbi:hypothetical protein N7492_001856 [Penicillium capsulatum]|uniref:Uncharacterized protein n=1 Tax=Penicillium capsulatum TaxID=69766 RepID=A0A9W9M084_9EURO|nr:hypothetical protein N7492_001856 [Penicillium capsulatum]KAJ6129095.1 hypothetical protein N7512_001875 [Penicillium capsulatum]
MSTSSLEDLDPSVAQILGYLGNTPAWTCGADHRFCYFLYVPKNYYRLDRLDLLVLMHQSRRNASEIRQPFVSFAEENSCLILAPLFPIAPDDPRDSAGYKLLQGADVRYDHIVLTMIDEVRARYTRVQVDRFFLFGFSGGAQFAHRFAYLHPQRLKALACGAPGSQTFPDTTRPWPEGVKDLEQVFGRQIAWQQLSKVPTMFIVGDADTDTRYATARGRALDPSIENGRLGATTCLEESWRAQGARCHLHVVPGVSHQEHELLRPVADFFIKCMG